VKINAWPWFDRQKEEWCVRLTVSDDGWHGHGRFGPYHDSQRAGAAAQSIKNGLPDPPLPGGYAILAAGPMKVAQ